MKATVVVPTRDRPDSLASCLAALGAQTVDAEIVVVDDASTDATAIAAIVGRSPSARLVRGEGQGPATARNLGAAHATTEILCFTDDDCRPEPGWVEAMVRRIEGGAVAVAGPTRNGRPDDRFAAASQTVTNHLTDSTLDPAAGTLGFAPTCNLAVRADVFASLPFDESFPLAAGEDRAWCTALLDAGHELVFEPAATVDHHQVLGWRGFWRQQSRYGRGAHHLRAINEAEGLQGPRFYVDLLRAGFRQGAGVGALVVLAQLATAAGLAGIRAREIF